MPLSCVAWRHFPCPIWPRPIGLAACYSHLPAMGHGAMIPPLRRHEKASGGTGPARGRNAADLPVPRRRMRGAGKARGREAGPRLTRGGQGMLRKSWRGNLGPESRLTRRIVPVAMGAGKPVPAPMRPRGKCGPPGKQAEHRPCCLCHACGCRALAPREAFQNRVGTAKASAAGGVAEWSNAAVLKTVEGASPPGVRIPPPPPGRFRAACCKGAQPGFPRGSNAGADLAIADAADGKNLEIHADARGRSGRGRGESCPHSLAGLRKPKGESGRLCVWNWR